MINKICDIRNALSNHCYLSGLALALTIPDICGKIEYPNLSDKKAYIKWFDANVKSNYSYLSGYTTDGSLAEINGEVCYGLRCAYLHSGNLDVNSRNKFTSINDFEFSLSSEDDDGVYYDGFSVVTTIDSKEENRKVNLDIRRFCHSICNAGEAYFRLTKDKSVFDKYVITITDF